MKVHALFADGTVSPVGIELDASREPKVFVLGQPSRQLALSAERGVSAAYLALRRRGLVQGQYASFCELTGAPAAVVGESAGLAFALGFAAAALACEKRGARPRAVAATGIVSSATADAAVGPVDGVAAKLAGAITTLPSGALFFYPSANTGDVGDDARSAAAARSVELVPVRTVDDAIARLGSDLPRIRRRGRVGLALGAVVLVMVLGGLATRAPAQLERAVRAGDFAALRGRWGALWLDGRARTIRAAARRDLTVVLSLRSLSAGVPAGELVLGRGDRYRLEVEPSRDCWLYAIQTDSEGGGTVLFPNPALSAERNPLRGGTRHVLPDAERWLVLDERPGKETIVVVASAWPAEDIESLIAAVPPGDMRVEAPGTFDAFAERAALRRAGRVEDGLRGLVYEELSFAHR
jgi:hypothetical protein